MDAPHPPAGIMGALKAAWAWLTDVAKAPTRLKALAEAKAADADPRPTCLACGVGRVSAYVTVPGYMISSFTYGRCGHCAVSWEMETSPPALVKIAAPPAA